MEKYVKAVWDDILDGIKDSIDDPESRQALKNIIDKALIKNKNKLPSGGSSSGDDDEKPTKSKNAGSTITSTKGTLVSAYNLHWGKWKEENTQAIWADPDDESKKISQHKYWQKHIWPNLSKAEKEKYDKLAKDARSDVKKIETKNGTVATKRGASKSGYQVFLEKMKELIDKDQEFTDPESGETVKLHKYLIYVWNTHIKTNKDLKEPFESMAKSIRESDEDTYDLNDLPYLDVDKLIAGDLEDLELISN
jgi:hypothetical protein